MISPSMIMGVKKSSQNPEKDIIPVMESSSEKIEATFKHSLISS